MESLSHLRVLVRNRRGCAGFTLIEMLVVLAIIIIVTAIALAGQSGFNRTEALNNMAYDIGLSMRQAASYGISNAINSAGVGQGSNIPYGVSFDVGSPNSFALFADTYPSATGSCVTSPKPDCQSGNREYDSDPGQDLTVQTFTLNNGFTISAFCAKNGSNKTSCTNDKNTPLKKLSVTFARPNADTTIAGKDAQNSWRTDYLFACIQLSSGSGEVRYVSVSATGQVLAGGQATADPSTLCPAAAP